MNMSVEDLKSLVKNRVQTISSDSTYRNVSNLNRFLHASIDKKNLSLPEKIEWAEKEYYINLFLQPSEKEALSRIMWEYWNPTTYISDLYSESKERLAYGSFFDRYNQPTFEEFKKGAPLHREATADTSAMAL